MGGTAGEIYCAVNIPVYVACAVSTALLHKELSTEFVVVWIINQSQKFMS